MRIDGLPWKIYVLVSLQSLCLVGAGAALIGENLIVGWILFAVFLALNGVERWVRSRERR